MMSLVSVGCIALGLFQFYLTYIGFQSEWGTLAAVIGVLATIMFRTSILLVLGSYMGAVHVLGWSWWEGVLVAAPALCFLMPGQIVRYLRKHLNG